MSKEQPCAAFLLLLGFFFPQEAKGKPYPLKTFKKDLRDFLHR